MKSQTSRLLLRRCAWIMHVFVATWALQAHAQTPSKIGAEMMLEGVLKPVQDIDVATTEVGIVRQILVQPGDRVSTGQAIAILDADAIEAQLRVKAAEAGARGKLSQAMAELQLQQSKYDRLSAMLLERKASRMEVERAEADLIIAKGRLANEQDQVNILQLDLERVQKLLEERTIRSPCDGIVVEAYKQVGEYVASNSPNLIRVIDVRKLKTVFPLDESELNGVQIGKPMMLELASGKKVQGVVDFVPPVADASSGWFMISVTIDNQDEKIIGSRCVRVR